LIEEDRRGEWSNANNRTCGSNRESRQRWKLTARLGLYLIWLEPLLRSRDITCKMHDIIGLLEIM
jgi:hypothetical protein